MGIEFEVVNEDIFKVPGGADAIVISIGTNVSYEHSRFWLRKS